VPVIANNRIGTEIYDNSRITFYGGSFIAGQQGEVVAQVSLVARCCVYAWQAWMIVTRAFDCLACRWA
jgi:predicted amidohydrolase